jgi:hypothetical protein
LKRTHLTVLGLLAAAACTEKPAPVSVEALPGPPAVGMLVSQDYVPTPAGWFHRSCIHEVPDNARIATRSRVVTRRDGSTYQVPACTHPSYRTRPVVSRSGGEQPPPVASGWIESASDYLVGSNRYSLLMAKWTVPAAPVGGYSAYQVYYTFPGFQSSEYINQPVLSYGYSGSYWEIASWHCNDGSNCYHSTLRAVTVGDTLFGKVASSNCEDGECDWMIQTWDLTSDVQTVLWDNDTEDYWWSTGGAVEVYNLTSCSQFPAAGVFYNWVVLFDTAQQVTPNWATDIQQGVSPSCGYAVSTTPSSVSLYHSVQPPPALDNWIYVQAPTYTAEPSGGYPPYSYLWEVCALDCEGGERAPIAGGARPNTVVHGWQYLSSQQQVYWTTSGWNLRSTVTDAQSQQAQAEYHVP